jgi:hypothetical protein
MSVDPVDDLLIACVSFVGAQRRLLDLLAESGANPAAVRLIMAAELDQLAAAAQRAQEHHAPRQRNDPGA